MARTVEVVLSARTDKMSQALLGVRRTVKQTASEIKSGFTDASSSIRRSSADLAQMQARVRQLRQSLVQRGTGGKYSLTGIDRAKAKQELSDLREQVSLAREARDAATQTANQVGTGMLKAGVAVAAGVAVVAKAAMDWQSAFAGVRKTVDETDPAFNGLEGQLRQMARTMATSHEEIAAVAENAGALGVRTKDIAQFTRTMVMLGETTNLTADEASTSMAQFMTIMGTAPDRVGRLAAALVDLGNNGASTEAQIMEMSQRLAGAGRAVGLTESQVMGFASAIASTGINVEAGGTAMSRVFTRLDRIVAGSGDKLEALSDFTGTDFAKVFREDASKATTMLVEKLGDLQKRGGSITGVLDSLGIKGIYESDVLRRLAGAGGLLADQLGISELAMRNGTAALIEYGKRAETDTSKVKVAWNNMKDAAIDAGSDLLPMISDAASGLVELMHNVQGLPGPLKATAVNLAGVTTATLLLGGGALKAVAVGGKLLSMLRELEISSPRAAGGLKKAAIAAGLLAAAQVAGRALGASLDEQAEQARTKGTDLAVNYAQGFANGMKGQTFDFASLFKDAKGDALIGDRAISGADALRRIFNPNAWERFNTAISTMTTGTDAGARLRGELGEIDKAMAMLAQSGNGEAAGAMFRDFSQFVTDSGVDMAQVIPDMKQYRQSLDQVAEGLGLQGQITEGEFIDWMGGKVPDAVKAATDAGGPLVDSLTDDQKALLGVQDSAEGATEALKQYAAKALAAAGSTLAVQQAFDQLKAPGVITTDKKTGEKTASGGIIRKGGFDSSTVAGAHNLEQIYNTAGTAQAQLQALKDAGADTEKLAATTEKWRKQLAEAYVAGGKNEDVAAALAATYIAMPDEIAPTFSSPGAVLTKEQAKDVAKAVKDIPSVADVMILAPSARPSKKQVDDFINSVDDIPRGKEVDIRTIAELSGIEAAQDALDALTDKTLTVHFVPDVSKVKNAQDYIKVKGGHYAEGGKQVGPGTGTSDSIIAAVSNGEWVIREKPSKMYGDKVMAAINAGAIPPEVMKRAAFGPRVMGYAGGGKVGDEPTYQGHSLSWWEDHMMSDLELTRLKIRIRDLKADLKGYETYNPKGPKKKAKRKKLRGLDRTEAKLELKELEQQLRDAITAAKLNKSSAGTLADRIEAYTKMSDLSSDFASDLGKSPGLSAFAGPQQHTNSNGDVWYTDATAASIAGGLAGHDQKLKTFAQKLDALRKAGAGQALLEDLKQVALQEGLDAAIKMADAFLSDKQAIVTANNAYADIQKVAAATGATMAATSATGATSVPAGAATAVQVQAQISQGTMAKALQGVALTLLVDGKPIKAIVKAELSSVGQKIDYSR